MSSDYLGRDRGCHFVVGGGCGALAVLELLLVFVVTDDSMLIASFLVNTGDWFDAQG